MTRWYSEFEGLTQISLQEKLLRDKIEAVMKTYVTEMEHYSYYGSNPGISEDDLEAVADELLLTFKIEEK